MRIVVVGATGSTGTALLRAVAARSSVTHVDAVSRRGAGRLAPSPHVRHHALDAAAPEGSSDAQALAELAAGADAVVHLAWTSQRSTRATTAANVALTRGVLRAATGAHQLVLASCASVYAPSYGTARRDEDWPATGVPGVAASADKVGLERLGREFGERYGIPVTTIRSSTVLQESAGAELVRRHVGPLVPRFGLGERIPLLLWPEGLRLQVVHADDVAAAFLAAVERRAPGTYNVTAPQVLDGDAVGAVLGADRVVHLSRTLARAGHEAAWWTRLVRARPDWLELLEAAPVLDGSRAVNLLGVVPQRDALTTLREAARGVSQRREGWTPALSRSSEPAPEHDEA